MIKSLFATGLNNGLDFDLTFHPDLNIITGKNGSGKTTVLKLIWYAISGNLDRIMREIPFTSFRLKTDTAEVGVRRSTVSDNPICIVEVYTGRSKKTLQVAWGAATEPGSPLEEANQLLSRANGSSVFFPTFRRIEGGFSIPAGGRNYGLYGSDISYARGTRIGYPEVSELAEAFASLCRRVSVGSHRFVASISTDDINRLLTLKYAENYEKTNRLQMELADFILKSVEVHDGRSDTTETPQILLDDIRARAKTVIAETKMLLKPFDVLSELITKIFEHNGIRISGPLTLGDAKNAIASETLSAGEKQMLSFLCYNAFETNSTVFIDEPEISLHVDWQRILFPVLLEQAAGNQFIVATHSPFIYTRYADKELILSQDRGDNVADAADD